MRRWDIRTAIAAQIIVAEVIRHDDDNIGARLRIGSSAQYNQQADNP